ncbi:medium-chain fatty-acid--CoA ligase [soil metagenome]
MSAPTATIHDRFSEAEIAEFYKSGVWMKESFYQTAVAQAKVRPDKVYVFDGATSLTYGDFRESVLRLAVGLRRFGVERGDRVAVQLPNWTEFAVLAGAISRIGAIIVPIMPIYRGNDVGFVLENSGAVVAITAHEFRGFDHLQMFQELRSQAPDLRHLVAVRPGADLDRSIATPFGELLVDGDLDSLEAEAGPDSSPDDGFEIVYTSGTTSRPKGCYHTLNTGRASAVQMAKEFKYTEKDVQFGPSPITHSTGLVTSVLMPMLVGASSYLMDAWEPKEGLRLIQEHGITAAVTATPFLQMLMAAYDPQQHDASSLRLWVCAGAPIPGSVVEQSAVLFPGCRTLSLYGRSENLVSSFCTLEDPPERSVTSDGRAVWPSQIEVVDDEGRVVPRGEVGDIAFRGASHMLEYYRNEAETAALFTPDGFSRSGDLGHMDEDGYIRVTGRSKDIIIRGGMNISAREIEEHLLAHEAVKNVAVVAMPDARLGEKVCAYVVLADDVITVGLSDLTDFLRGHQFAVQKLPERLEIVSELPITATGKVQKHVLRADISEKLAQAQGAVQL